MVGLEIIVCGEFRDLITLRLDLHSLAGGLSRPWANLPGLES